MLFMSSSFILAILDGLYGWLLGLFGSCRLRGLSNGNCSVSRSISTPPEIDACRRGDDAHRGADDALINPNSPAFRDSVSDPDPATTPSDTIRFKPGGRVGAGSDNTVGTVRGKLDAGATFWGGVGEGGESDKEGARCGARHVSRSACRHA
jgi:hypothetical protein